MLRWYDSVLWRTYDTGEGSGGGGEGEGGEGGEGQPRTYTKAEIDGMVSKAVQKAVKPFADYQELKTKADKLAELEGASQSNEQRLTQAHAAAVRERDAAIQRATDSMIRAAVVAEASTQGAIDPAAVAALIDRAELEITDTGVEGVEEAVRSLLAAKSYLVGGRQARRSGAEIQGGQQGTPPTTVTQSQHREWLRTGQMTKEREALVETARRTGQYQAGR